MGNVKYAARCPTNEETMPAKSLRASAIRGLKFGVSSGPDLRRPLRTTGTVNRPD
jgi:hypothetical protein